MGKLVTRTLDQVESETVEWLWPGFIPLGKLTLVSGDPGQGKSAMLDAITANVTRGAPIVPGDAATPKGRVLVLQAEDGLADTIKPRLDELGADLSSVTVIEASTDNAGRQHSVNFQQDLDSIDAELASGGYRLLRIDPLTVYLGPALKSREAADVRSHLMPLVALAEKYHIAVVGVRHLTKNQETNPLYRGQDSIAFTAVARCELLVAPDPNPIVAADGTRYVVRLKGNLGPPPPAIEFIFESSEKYPLIGLPRFIGPAPDVTVEYLLGKPGMVAAPSRPSEVERAWDYMRGALATGPVLTAEVIEGAIKVGISKASVIRARDRYPVESFRDDGHWWMRLTDGGQESQPKPIDDLENLANLENLEDSDWQIGIPLSIPVVETVTDSQGSFARV